jgi:hypothetical protein
MVESANDDPDQVEPRLREALDAHGLQLFARIGVELPLQMLIWHNL